MKRLNWTEWEKIYKRITETLNIDRNRDLEAVKAFKSQSRNKEEVLQALTLLARKPTIVFGAGPSLSKDLRKCFSYGFLSQATTVVADGGCSEFVSQKLIPDVVFSDLDGEMSALLQCAKAGSIMVVHAHGDNIPMIKKWGPTFQQKKSLFTVQVSPPSGIFNFGGFTDGDRACYAMVELGAPMIALAGFDLGEIVGKSSKKEVDMNQKATPRKITKLKIAKELLEELSRRITIPLYNLTSEGVPIDGFPFFELV